jgi:hypothetical protein
MFVSKQQVLDYHNGPRPGKTEIMSRPVYVLQSTATVEDVVNVAAIAVMDAQENDTYTHLHVSLEPELIGED